MPLQATSGAASYDAFGGGAAAVPQYIEEVFSTYLVTGDGSAPAVNNGIDVSGKGGLVWTKKRSAAGSHSLFDTARGANLRLISNDTAAQDSVNLSFTSTGFSNYTFDSAVTYASWTFRKQPKFFDVVTFTKSSSPQTISHSLGSTPGCIFIKRTDSTGGWLVAHRGYSGGITAGYTLLNTTDAFTSDANAVTAADSTSFALGSSVVSGDFVAYLFAHNAGGFGLTGTDNVISCGSFTTDGSGAYSVTLGYEPQFVLMKRTDSTGDWLLMDNMRGMPVGGNDAILRPNTSGAETETFDCANPTATGFYESTGSLGASRTYIYIAIRRGPMKVPTSGTSVFAPVLNTGTGSNTNISSGSFAPDMLWNKTTDHAYGTEVWDKLRGVTKVGLTPSSTAAEGTSPAGYDLVSFNNTGVTEGSNSGSVMNITSWLYVNYMFGRAPSFFDVVCYTGTGVSSQTFNHNLGVVPELMIVKCRSQAAGGGWVVYSQALGNNSAIILNSTGAAFTPAAYWNTTSPTASVFSVNADTDVGNTGRTYVNYLFATCAGVSKVGSYTGTGTTLQIDCGFTSGARFVLIKRTDSTGDWYVWDSARGIVSGNDPYLLLNSTAAEVTNTDYVDTYNAGFEISSTAPSAINASGGTFIFLAIA